MTGVEYQYIKEVLRAGLIQSPCLEMGVGYGGPNAKALIQDAGIKYVGTDIVSGKDVDYVVNFEDEVENIKKVFSNTGDFSSVLATSILEHVFEPIKILDHIFAILRAGGTCVITVPAVWPIHNYPVDCWRFNPNFFEEYCKRRSLHLVKEYFKYIGFKNVYKYLNNVGCHTLPEPGGNKFQTLKSRVIHKIFNTCGRGMFFPSNVAIGVTIRK